MDFNFLNFLSFDLIFLELFEILQHNTLLYEYVVIYLAFNWQDIVIF